MGAPLILSMRRANKQPSKVVIASSSSSALVDNVECISKKKKRSKMRLSIAPDVESESMQVNLVEGSPINKSKNRNDKLVGGFSPAKEGDCIYTVGSVDYLVKHNHANAGIKNDASEDDEVGGNDIDRVDDDIATKFWNVMPKDEHVEASASSGGDKKKKSRMGGMFKKKGKDKNDKDNNDNEKEQNDNGNNNNGGNDDQNGDKNNDDKNNQDNNQSNNPTAPTNPTFAPDRIAFAKSSTLPLHSESEATAPTSHPSWTPVNGNEFKVRHGPNYPKNGKKENSGDSLYEVYCVRFFRSERRTRGGATRIMPLPGLEDEEEDGDEVGEDGGKEEETAKSDGAPNSHCHPELNNTKIPHVLVVHFMLPYEPPNMFKQRDDGPGGECIYYLKPSRRLLDELSGKIPITPATELFVKWCETSETDLKMRSRFKCMALVRDIDRHNFGLLKSYNGKPVLITESGRASSGCHGDVRYLEMTANVHYWAFMAKKGFVSLIPKFANMQMEVGFTIEAHADSEMPECMLGSTVLSYISDSTGPMISKEMQEPVHEHQS